MSKHGRPAVIAAGLLLISATALGGSASAAGLQRDGDDTGVRTGANTYNPFASRNEVRYGRGGVRPAPGGGSCDVYARFCPQPGEDPCAGVDIACRTVEGPTQAAAPTVSPATLAQRAGEALTPPAPDVRTAPPRGSDGLVGLPHWVWVAPGQWRPRTERATAGPVWAEVTATPEKIIIRPGAGQPTVECVGPGTPYDRSNSATAQRPGCSHTFTRSSAGQPGSAYTMTVTVVWRGTWVGSGGSGGSLPDISRSTSFPLRVAEGQALNRGG